MSVPIVGKLTARIDRIAVLEKQIEWIEAHSRSHYRYHYHGNGNNNNDSTKSIPYSLGTKPY
jgi:hypothetical protein